MPSLDRILLPVDFSGRSLGAARYAEVLAARFGSEVTLLHVLAPPHYEFAALEDGASVLAELHTVRSRQAARDLEGHLTTELAGVSVKRVLLEGDPARRIVEYAHQQGAGLIVMPTHGYGPFRRFILGSVAAKILHDADCPVMTGVHLEQAPGPGPIAVRRVLAAVDLGPQSGRAIEWAAWMASAMGAAVSVVHATPCLESRAGEYFDPDWSRRLADGAREQISRLVAGTAQRPDVVIENGDAPGAVCAAAARLSSDLLVIGRGSAAGMFGRLRTNAYAIIRQSPCPVVSV